MQGIIMLPRSGGKTAAVRELSELGDDAQDAFNDALLKGHGLARALREARAIAEGVRHG